MYKNCFSFFIATVTHDILNKIYQCNTEVSNHRNSLNIPKVWRGQEDSTTVQQGSWGDGPGSRMKGQTDAGESSEKRKNIVEFIQCNI